MFNRRDLLKMLGAGATIVPVIGGVPEVAAQARLIAEPQIEPVQIAQLHEIPRFFSENRNKSSNTMITVDIVNEEGHYRFQAESFVVGWEMQPIDVSLYGDYYKRTIPGPRQWEWELRGKVIGDGNFHKAVR